MEHPVENGSSAAELAATTARVLVTLLHSLKRDNKSLGLATLCGGGGVAMACAIEMM